MSANTSINSAQSVGHIWDEPLKSVKSLSVALKKLIEKVITAVRDFLSPRYETLKTSLTHFFSRSPAPTDRSSRGFTPVGSMGSAVPSQPDPAEPLSTLDGLPFSKEEIVQKAVPMQAADYVPYLADSLGSPPNPKATENPPPVPPSTRSYWPFW